LNSQTCLPNEAVGPPPNKKLKTIEDEKIANKNKFLLRPVEMNTSSLNITNTKFVRLIVANEPNKNKVNHITAHIEPMNINVTNSVNSRLNSQIDKPDTFNLATEKVLIKGDSDVYKLENSKKTNIMKINYHDVLENDSIHQNSDNIEDKISETIK
jgi:hypothetical protein